MPEQQWILDTISRLNSEGSPHSIAEALQQLAEKLGLDRCILRYREGGSDVFRVIAEHQSPELLPIDTLEPEMDSAASLALVQQLLQNGHVDVEDVCCEAGFSDEEVARAMDWGCRSLLFLPLRYQNAINGMIIAIQAFAPRQWSASDRFVVQLIGETALSVWLRDRSMQALYDSRQQYRWAVEVSNDALFEWHIQRNTISHSPRFFQILARPFVDSMTVPELIAWVHPDDVELLQDKMRDAAAGELLKTRFELRMIDSNEEVVWLMVGAAVVAHDEDGRPLRAVGTLSDITTFKKTLQHLELLRQDAERANLAKSEFLARMSHEVRTPLNAITGMLHLLEDSPLDEAQQARLAIMQDASRQLLGVLNDILDLSRIESGKLQLEQIPFDLDQLVQQRVAMFAAQASDKGVELLVSFDTTLPAQVQGDPGRLSQVLGNLLSNALKFTSVGQVVLSVRRRALQRGCLTLEFEISDTGVGMTAEQLDRLFNPFVQAELHIARQYGGSGLGLSICKSLVELMGGHILARSTEGQGSQFLFTLQLACEQAQPPALAPDAPLQGRQLVLCRSPVAAAIYQNLFAGLGMDCLALPAALSYRQLSQCLQALPPAARLWLDAGFAAEELELLERELGDSPLPLVLLPQILDGSLRNVLERHPGWRYLAQPLTPARLRQFLWPQPALAGQARFALSASDRQRLAQLRVLLVEDNPVNRMVAEGLLSRYGIHTVSCEHGKQALDEIWRQPAGYFQAVLMDLEMPVMDGFTATRQIRQMDKARHLPVIAMTANTLTVDVQRCQQAGMYRHIGKPIDPQQLVSCLLSLPE
ncbi:MAG TPA: ATP-binding protein [Pseudomonadales bacterium]